MAEWERNPGRDEVFAALTQTGEKKTAADQEEEEVEESGKQQRKEGGKEEANEAGGKNPGFSFLGRKGRKEDELTLRAVHGYRCKWDAKTMHIPPIDMNVPESQKYGAMRTQIA